MSEKGALAARCPACILRARGTARAPHALGHTVPSVVLGPSPRARSRLGPALQRATRALRTGGHCRGRPLPCAAPLPRGTSRCCARPSPGAPSAAGDLKVRRRRDLGAQPGDPQGITCLCRQTSWAPRPARWPQCRLHCVCGLPPPSARPVCPRRTPGRPADTDAGQGPGHRVRPWGQALPQEADGPWRPGHSQAGRGPEATVTGENKGGQGVLSLGWSRGEGTSREGVSTERPDVGDTCTGPDAWGPQTQLPDSAPRALGEEDTVGALPCARPAAPPLSCGPICRPGPGSGTYSPAR